MPIICGKCKGTHDTSVQVRNCYDLHADHPAAGVIAPEFDPMDVPPGRYALQDADQTLHFYKVDHGSGRWSGYVFLEELTGAPGTFAKYPIKDKTRRLGLLRNIAADIEGSAKLFGRELGICARCASPLTNEESRRLGLGPECRKAY